MPGQKIYDIIPPEKAEREKPVSEGEKSKPVLVLRKPSLSKKWLAVLVLAPTVLFLFIYFSLNPTAKATLFIKTDVLETQTSASLSVSAKESDSGQGLIPATVLIMDKTGSGQFQATGKEQKKGFARGKITVYNNYSTAPQPLVARTRFVSAEGKLFRTEKSATIAGIKTVEGKSVPGTTEIEAVADEPGEDYNIGPTTFSIPGFVGTARYTAIYAKSFSPMAGGMLKEASIITQQDLDLAKDRLLKDMSEEGTAELRKRLPEGFILLEKTVTLDNAEVLSGPKPKEEASSFKLELRSKLRAFIFKRSDLNRFVAGFAEKKIPQGKLLKDGSIEANYTASDFNFETSRAKIDFDIKAAIYSEIDFKKIKEEIAGQELFFAERKILEISSEISRVKLSIQPLWIQRLPKALNKINIGISLD